jgi:very-short-patch-repair endonuclease
MANKKERIGIPHKPAKNLIQPDEGTTPDPSPLLGQSSTVRFSTPPSEQSSFIRFSPPHSEQSSTVRFSPPPMDISGLTSFPLESSGSTSPPLEEIAGFASPPLEGCPKGGVAFPILTTIHSVPIRRNFVQNLPYNPALALLARKKRKEGILSEVLFWQQVHKGLFHKIDFDRQRVIGNYIVDFYVKTLGLIIEIDGSSHDNKQEYDSRRQQYLESFGLIMYRIADGDVKMNLGREMEKLEKFIIQEYGRAVTPPREWNKAQLTDNNQNEGDQIK